VAQAKGELIDFVEKNGSVVLNRDDAFYSQWKARAGNRNCVSFGEHADADIRVLLAEGTRLELSVNGEKVLFEFALIGKHNSLNAAAAVAVAIVAGVPLSAIKSGLKKIRAVPGRLNVLQIAPGFMLIDDSYNANQDSMFAAIDVLAEQAGKKILALGAMGELGAESAKIHHDIAFYAKQKGIDNLLTLVERHDANYLQDMSACLEGFGAGSAASSTVQDLAAKIISLSETKTVLVKGSRLARMERLIDALKNIGGASC
jgi:UDP-N-acetylmuramoyl-tripeptide--D-alanyl-D-alanine ligase